MVLLVAIGAVAGVSFYSQSLEKKATDLANDISLKQIETMRVASATRALPLLLESEEKISGYIVKTSDIVPFLEQLEKQGKAQGALVEVLSVQPEKSATTRRITLSLNISGSFDSVVRTLGAIEYGPYDVFVTTTTLSGGGSEAGKPPVWTAGAVFSLGTDAGESLKK